MAEWWIGDGISDRSRNAPIHSSFLGCSRSVFWLLGFHQVHVHDVLVKEPRLGFILAQHTADQQIVGGVVPELAGSFGGGSRVLNDRLMPIKQARDLHWHFFSAVRRAFYDGALGDFMGHSSR